ncbi:MAG TPA: glycosyltransferase family 4 protein [Gemmatimonadales bacterium]|nr:glycosyltransferase family 4 protein [Gemmatimonadales bacterium]
MTRTVIHFVDSDTFGGSEQSLLHLLAGLDRNRWRPVLLHHPAAGLAQLVQGAQAAGVAVRSVPRMTDRNFAWRLAALGRVLVQERPAVFHAHLNWPLACKFGLLTARALRVPAIVGTAQLFVEALVNRSVRVQQRIVAAAVDRYLAVSSHVARRLAESLRIPDRKIRVVHNGIDPAPFEMSWEARPAADVNREPRQPSVVTLARLSAQKGIDTLLTAASQVPEARFFIVGDGSERAALEAQAQSLGVSDRVSFLGHRRDVPALLASADVFAFPSLFEGLPLSVLEAMAAAKPVVASRVGGTDEAVVDGVTGILVPPSDPAALAQAIRTVLADPQLAARLGGAGRARVHEAFTAQAMVRGVEAVYDELLARPRIA